VCGLNDAATDGASADAVAAGQLVALSAGHALHVVDEGQGDAEPLVLLHALGTDASLWDAQARHFAPARRVLRIDAPGHGSTPPWPRGSVTLGTLAEAVWSLLDGLQVDRVVLVGTSMGAVVALQAAALQPARVHRLVLCGAHLVRAAAASAELSRRSEAAMQHGGMERVARTMLDRWFPPASAAAGGPGVAHVRHMLLQTDPGSYAACAHAMAAYDLSPHLAALQDRSLLVTGECDGDVAMHFQALQQAYPGLQTLCIPAAGHFPAYDMPDVFNRVVAGFLDDRRPRRAGAGKGIADLRA